uniref:RNase H type-1 domain-containing protein n=1 Tax=Gossypium raimondii TaxID=29730 RepID=A0A0D2V078_GOSRA|nr:hypothetical protein B456_009G397500 [Gossypium raimondii]
MGSCTYLIKNIRYLTIVEAYACLHGVAFAEDLGFQDIILEGDSLTVVKKLQKNNDYIDRSVIRGIIEEIKTKARNFKSLIFRHIPWEANEAAHAMAAWGEEGICRPSEWKKPRGKSIHSFRRIKGVWNEGKKTQKRTLVSYL